MQDPRAVRRRGSSSSRHYGALPAMSRRAAERHHAAEWVDVDATQLAFSILEFNRVHGVRHSGRWKNLLYLEACQVLIGIMLR